MKKLKNLFISGVLALTVFSGAIPAYAEATTDKTTHATIVKTNNVGEGKMIVPGENVQYTITTNVPNSLAAMLGKVETPPTSSGNESESGGDEPGTGTGGSQDGNDNDTYNGGSGFDPTIEDPEEEVYEFEMSSETNEDINIVYVNTNTNTRATSPEGVLTITDTPDAGMGTINTDSIVITFNGNDITSDATITSTSGGGFIITLDLLELASKGKLTQAHAINCSPITITYTMTIASNITPGTYSNNATVDYSGDDYSDSTHYTDEVTSNVYGIRVYGYNSKTSDKMDGLTFAVNNNTLTTTTDNIHYDYVITNKNAEYSVTQTNSTHKNFVYSKKPVNVVIPADTSKAADDNYIYVSFPQTPVTPNPNVPETGSPAMMITMLVGAAAIILGAGVTVAKCRKK